MKTETTSMIKVLLSLVTTNSPNTSHHGYSRHSSRDIKEFLTGPPVLHISPYLLDDNAHEDCPDDSRCILIIASPFSNELAQFKCVHCKKMGDFISHLTFTDKRPPYQCTLCRLHIHHECLISSNIKGCCIAF